ncbi:MAG TPA: cytochrome P450 [Candidatus Dormibacteraeota bacterium]|nr:cytochrome P450 [Candidatus Dormibacteraeota bacterium]
MDAQALADARTVGDIPALATIPWLGQPWAFLSHPGEYLLRGYRQHGPVFRTRLFGMSLVALLGPEANRRLMVTHRDHFSHAMGYAMVRKVLGDGLLFQDGAVHARNRTLMTPAFHQRAINSYFDLMQATAAAHAARWTRTGRAPMYERFRQLTFEIMARLVLGLEGDLRLAELGALNHQLAKGSAAFLRVGWRWTTYGKGLRARDALRAYLRTVIAGRRGAPGADALGLLMAARDVDGAALGDGELLDQAVILMFAGHETTTSLLTSFTMAMRDHPGVAEALVDEQRRVVGDGPLRVEHLRELVRLDATLKEVERLLPPISLGQRGVAADVEVGGYHLPAGTMVIYSSYVTHRLPGVFRDPERFDPDRFLPPREEHKATPYALVGFGGGPRLCIGLAFAQLEAKVVASLLLRRYRWQLDPGPTALRWVPTLHPLDGLPGTVAPA